MIKEFRFLSVLCSETFLHFFQWTLRKVSTHRRKGRPSNPNPMINKLASFLRYSTHGQGSISRNRNNKEQICLKPIRFKIHFTFRSEPFLEGPCSIADKKGQLRILHAARRCTLNVILPLEFRWTGKQYNMRTNGVFFNKPILIQFSSNLYPHLYSPLPTI